ncbi:hypothetical protein [Streptomyces sp. NPDC001893]|uniref:hypothetical protein n=1 Tax=Streptomyces sp. NPDC001893 TaxID=3154530 RepID=UPI00332D3BEB
MTDHVTKMIDRLREQTHLREALEERCGSARNWSPQVAFAYSQLIHLEQSIGADAYAEFLECAAEGVNARAAAHDSLGEMHSDYYGRAVYSRHKGHKSPQHEIAWAMMFSLQILLRDEGYENLVLAAAEAHRTNAAELAATSA